LESSSETYSGEGDTDVVVVEVEAGDEAKTFAA
jgi:hypothetical protein